MTSSLRDRRRAVATREILDAARQHVAEHGPAGLALRAVARGLGMTVQALYHYFPSKAELLTALIAEAYEDLADALQAAVDAAATDRFLVLAEAFRGWAVDNSGRFELLYGTPLRQYAAPLDGPTTAGARRLAGIFIRELFAGIDRERLAAVDFGPVTPALHARLGDPATGSLPPPAAGLFISVWSHVHGLVVLEAFGHTAFIGPAQDDLFRVSVRALFADARRRMGVG